MSSARTFFYWGQVPLAEEVRDDVLAGLVQPRRSIPYARSYGGGLPEFENAPIAANTVVQVKYEAVRFMGVRNNVVTDGNKGVDRRAATSQKIITVDIAGAGLNISVPFVLVGALGSPSALQSVNIGGSK